VLGRAFAAAQIATAHVWKGWAKQVVLLICQAVSRFEPHGSGTVGVNAPDVDITPPE
jgi:hypothetical protein